MKEGDVKKLPIWAQNKIAHLEACVNVEKDRVRELTEKPPSTIQYQIRPGGEWLNLPTDRVRIQVHHGAWIIFNVDKHDPNWIHAMADYGIRIQGETYNTLYLIPERTK